jgi:hypothetical protein
MITPSYSLTATERVLPKLALDFTTAALDPRVTFTRSGNTATVINSSGVITAINADLPRFDYNPTTLVCEGLLIEEQRTNLLLNSLIDGTSLATQSVTVTAVAHTLSFYGTGTVTLSGAHSATVNGTGAYPTRTTLTFTPAAGSLTLTVSGTVQFANLEAGAFATSFIPTDATTKTRNIDVAKLTGSNFTSWFNATQGTLYAEGAVVNSITGTNARIFASLCNAGGTELFNLEARSSTSTRARSLTGGATVLASDSFNALGVESELAGSYIAGEIAMSVESRTPITAVSNVPSPDQMVIGTGFNTVSANFANGRIKRVMYWPQKLTLAELQASTK